MKILLADDDKFIRSLASARLKSYGFEVDTAVDGEEVISKMNTNPPDILLLDLVMPKKDGFTALKEIKADTKLSKIPVIIISALSQEEDKKSTVDAGASGFFDKTATNYESLKELINKLTAVTK